MGEGRGRDDPIPGFRSEKRLDSAEGLRLVIDMTKEGVEVCGSTHWFHDTSAVRNVEGEEILMKDHTDPLSSLICLKISPESTALSEFSISTHQIIKSPSSRSRRFKFTPRSSLQPPTQLPSRHDHRRVLHTAHPIPRSPTSSMPSVFFFSASTAPPFNLQPVFLVPLPCIRAVLYK